MTIELESADWTSLETEFMDLVLADHDLLQAEFDAIVDVIWTSRPPVAPRPVRWPSRTRPVGLATARFRAPTSPGGGQAHRKDRLLRGRSPPEVAVSTTPTSVESRWR
ncbi:MAG: hypothetical protein JWN95_3290 [Frankiales bacterium]|nr:hypothetical protein [Frankiales bacterium]